MGDVFGMEFPFFFLSRSPPPIPSPKSGESIPWKILLLILHLLSHSPTILGFFFKNNPLSCPPLKAPEPRTKKTQNLPFPHPHRIPVLRKCPASLEMWDFCVDATVFRFSPGGIMERDGGGGREKGVGFV